MKWKWKYSRSQRLFEVFTEKRKENNNFQLEFNSNVEVVFHLWSLLIRNKTQQQITYSSRNKETVEKCVY